MVCSPQTMEDFGQSLKGKGSGGIFREESRCQGERQQPEAGAVPQPFVPPGGRLPPPGAAQRDFGSWPKTEEWQNAFSSPAFVKGTSGCQGKFPYPAAFCSLGLSWAPLCSRVLGLRPESGNFAPSFVHGWRKQSSVFSFSD